MKCFCKNTISFHYNEINQSNQEIFSAYYKYMHETQIRISLLSHFWID